MFILSTKPRHYLCFLFFTAMFSADLIKQRVAEEAAALVDNDMVIGIGSGSTVFYFIRALASRVRNGLSCTGIPTSLETQKLASEQGIVLVGLNDVPFIDLAIDGADEIDDKLQLIKGGGGALLQEKMVAAAAKERVIIAGSDKLHPQLGSFPLPVEVIPYGWKQVQQKIAELYELTPVLRVKNNEPFLTDHGHYILDCPFQTILSPLILNNSLHAIPGVVETGLFIDMCEKAIIGYPDGTIRHLTKPV